MGQPPPIWTIFLELTAHEDGELTATGEPLRRAILRVMSSADPLTARAIRMAGPRGQIIASPLYTGSRPLVECSERAVGISRGATYRARVVTFSDAASTLIRNWAARSPKVRLSGMEFEVSSVEAERLGWEEIYVDEPVKAFRVNFLTPTLFRRQSTPYCRLFPLPSMLIHSLASSWNRLRGDGPRIRDVVSWARLSVVETGHELCTSRPIEVGGENVVGFVGWTHYKCIMHPNWSPKEHEEMAVWAGRLLRLGELVGVGAHRQNGLGIIRFSPKG